MNIYLVLFATILFSGECNKPEKANEHSFIVTITEPDKIKEITIPLKCKGWCVRGLTILENTANDSTRVWDKYFAPGQTGWVFSMECYDCYTSAVWTTRYIPYKATKGKIVMKWILEP